MRQNKGYSLVELVMVLVIVSITAAVFYGVIEKMFESANAIMARKEAYQQARVALKAMTDEVRWLLWGGPHHNFAMADRVETAPAAKWEYAPDFPCSSSRFAFFEYSPDQVEPLDFSELPQQLHPESCPGGTGCVDCGVGREGQSTNNERIRFFWEACTIGGVARWCFVRNEVAAGFTAASCDGAAGTETVLAVVRNSNEGFLTVRYYDQNRNMMTIAGSGLTQSQAQEVAWVEFLLTVTTWGETVTLSETVAVKKRGVYPLDYGAETYF